MTKGSQGDTELWVIQKFRAFAREAGRISAAHSDGNSQAVALSLCFFLCFRKLTVTDINLELKENLYHESHLTGSSGFTTKHIRLYRKMATVAGCLLPSGFQCVPDTGPARGDSWTPPGAHSLHQASHPGAP